MKIAAAKCISQIKAIEYIWIGILSDEATEKEQFDERIAWYLSIKISQGTLYWFGEISDTF